MEKKKKKCLSVKKRAELNSNDFLICIDNGGKKVETFYFGVHGMRHECIIVVSDKEAAFHVAFNMSRIVIDYKDIESLCKAREENIIK